MYLGRLVEGGPADGVFERPTHPYTRALLAASPDVDAEGSREVLLRGDPPSAAAPPTGCRFHPRCWLREQLGRPDRCETVDPERVTASGGAACHFPAEASAGPIVIAPRDVPARDVATGADGVTLANWQDPPHNRWAYLHIDQVLPTARIPRGTNPSRQLGPSSGGGDALERLPH